MHGKPKTCKERIKMNFHDQDVSIRNVLQCKAVLKIDSVYRVHCKLSIL